MLKKFYEAQQDGGQAIAPAGEEPIVVPIADESPLGPDPTQLILDQINQTNADADAAEAAADAAKNGGTTPDGSSSQQVSPDATSPGTAEDLILGRFKSKDDVVTAYQNLEPEYTQTRQQMRDMERQLAELQAQLEINNTDEDYSQEFQFEAPFSENPRNVEELEELAAQYPDRAAMFAINNANRLPAELVQEVVNYWHTRNPAQATAYMLQQMFQGYVPQIEQRLAPHDSSRNQAIVQSAVAKAEEAIGPTYGEYHDRIIDAIEANPALLPQDTSDTAALSQSIVRVYAMLVGMDQLERGKQLATQGQPPPAVSPATTQTRLTAAPTVSQSASQEDVEAARMIQNLILNSRG